MSFAIARLGQTSYRAWAGTLYPDEQEVPQPVQQTLGPLMGELKRFDLRTDATWCVAYRHLDYYPRWRNFLLRMATGKEDLVREILAQYRGVFSGLRAGLERVHQVHVVPAA